MKKKYLLVTCILVLSVNLIGYADDNKKLIKTKIHNTIYTFEIAETIAEQIKGLMFREKLDDNGGMFFVFDKEDYLSFHMKNTFIPLDVAFIDSSLTIVDIQTMYPQDNVSTVSKVKAQYALEVNKGFFERVGLSVGDKIELVNDLLMKIHTIFHPFQESLSDFATIPKNN